MELAKQIGADAIYAHREVSHDEVRAEERIEKAMNEENVDVKYFWGSTLYHIEDLPFGLEDMPSNYGGFRGKVKGLEVRKTIEALEQMKGLPSCGDVEIGEIPSLVDLGINPSATMAQVSLLCFQSFVLSLEFDVVVILVNLHSLSRTFFPGWLWNLLNRRS